MKRIQLFLDEDLWNVLRAQARRQGTTVSELVRQAARERYLGKMDERGAAMLGIVGIREDDSDTDSVQCVRSLRRGRRLFGFMTGEFRIVGDIESPPTHGK